MTLEAQLGLIGGTMGLLTGFSILSGVEIVYYAVKFFASFRVLAEVVDAVRMLADEAHKIGRPCWMAQRIFIIRIIFFYDVFSSF